MTEQGIVRKMETSLSDKVQYYLPLNDKKVFLNNLIGQPLKLSWKSEIYCLHCGKRTTKSFGQGYCYPCFISIPETEDCVMRPELCRAHEGIARDMEYAKEHCLQEHFVYLALACEIKVGVTRHTQIPTRWIDQGAKHAVRIASTPNRYLAGKIEVLLKDHYTDKTNWRGMLMDKQDMDLSLLEQRSLIQEKLPNEYQSYILKEDGILDIIYPGSPVKQKVISIDMEKIKSIEGYLTGIRGQYLIFDYQNVINIRKYGGYLLEMDYD